MLYQLLLGYWKSVLYLWHIHEAGPCCGNQTQRLNGAVHQLWENVASSFCRFCAAVNLVKNTFWSFCFYSITCSQWINAFVDFHTVHKTSLKGYLEADILQVLSVSFDDLLNEIWVGGPQVRCSWLVQLKFKSPPQVWDVKDIVPSATHRRGSSPVHKRQVLEYM